MIEIRKPKTEKEWDNYYDLRYRILRQPWNQPRGSERNDGDAAGQHFAFWENNEIVAIARLDKTDLPNECQVRFVAVETNQQGKGLGKKLMLTVEKKAKEQGFQRVLLHARENALEFYRSLGYEQVEKSQLLFDTIQHYLMKKSL